MSNEKNEKNPTGSQNEKNPATSQNQEADKKSNQNWNENAPKTGVKPTIGQAQESEEQTKTGYKPENEQKNKQQIEDSANQPKSESDTNTAKQQNPRS